MSWIAPVTLRSPRVTLEPLDQRHCDELIEAVKDGALWTLWYTNIPAPEKMRAEIDRRIERLTAEVTDQEALVEEFKSRNALLQNSLTYFAHVTHRLGEQTRRDSPRTAAAVGMVAEAEWRRILALLAALGFNLFVPELHSPQLIRGLTEFREHLGGELTVMLLERIGKGREVHEIDASRVSSAIGLLRQAGVLARNRVLEGRKYEQIDGQVHLDDQPNHRRLFH